MKSIRRRLKKTKKNRNKSKKLRKSHRQSRGGMFSHQPGVGRTGLGLRNSFINLKKRLTAGVDTSDCNKESFDEVEEFGRKVQLRKKCCGYTSSSPFCKYAKSITKSMGEPFPGEDYDVSEMDKIYGEYYP